jgi:lipid-A-disaccharide synthase
VKYFIIAGEASGDLHASNLVSEISNIDSSAKLNGMGGPKMSAAGVNLVVDYSDYSFMGFVEVIANLGKIKKLFTKIKSEISSFNPDRVILVDYGGFNLKIAKFCKEKGIETHFYILPKVWAWNEKRVSKIKKYVDVGYCIFPFEEDYFRRHGVKAHYVGNPVVEQIQGYLNDNSHKAQQEYVALLPGSRNQEITRILPTLLAFAKSRSDVSFKIAAHDPELFQPYTFPDNVELTTGDTYTTVYQAKAAIVTSGTANLETALLNTPQVVCYKANPVSFFLGKLLVKIKFISPVNLILDKLVIRELIQGTFNVVHLEEEVNKLLNETSSEVIKESYKTLWSVLGQQSAAKQAAIKITKI